MPRIWYRTRCFVRWSGGSNTILVGEADPEGRFYDSFLDDEITRAIRSLPEEYRASVVRAAVVGA